MTAQFMGDLAAFDRLEMLVDDLTRVDAESARTALIAAQVACSLHRFAEARPQSHWRWRQAHRRTRPIACC